MTGFGIQSSAQGFRSGSPKVVFDNELVIDAAFRHFRRVGFPYRKLPLHVCLQSVNRLANTDNAELRMTTEGYLVADTYHPHRFAGRHNTKVESPVECFGDDAFLLICLKKSLSLDGFIGGDFISGLRFVNGCKACSNFRPGFALLMYRKYCPPGGVVLDTSTGYGGRLVGWFASESSRYIGIDPNTLTYEGNLRMAKDFCRSGDVELYCLPAEDVDESLLRGRVDFAFTSPPYFAAEVYSLEGTQSCNRYKTSREWRDGFLLPMMRLQKESLKPGCYSCVNVADVKVKGESIPLVKWTKRAGELVGLEFVENQHYQLRRFLGSGGDKNKEMPRQESVLVFRKLGGS